MLRGILFLLFIYPFAEVISLLVLLHKTSLAFTLFYLLASAILGIIMLRNQQIGRLLTLGAIFRQGENISLYSMLWQLRYILAGVLFIIPGVISDIFAILLLLPIQLTKTNDAAQAETTAHKNNSTEFEFDNQSDEIIQGEYTIKEEKKDHQQS